MSSLTARLRRAGVGWMALALALLLGAALIGYHVGNTHADRYGQHESTSEYHLAPPSAIGFQWDSLSVASPLDDPRVDLVRAWVESALTLGAYHATYSGFVEATSPDVAPLPVSRLYNGDSRLGVYHLDLASMVAGPDRTEAVVCLDTLDVAGVTSGLGYLRTEWDGFLRMDLRFERSTAVGALYTSFRLDGRMPTDQALPPPDVFAGWMLVSGREVSDPGPCAAGWTRRHRDGFGWDGLPSPIPIPPFESEPGW